MNKTFDLHRFGMVLRWDLLTNRKSYFCSIAGLAIGIIMLSIPMLYLSRSGSSSAWMFMICQSLRLLIQR